MVRLGRQPVTLSERFWPKVNINPDGCWLWTGARSGNRYGLIRGEGGRHSKNEVAHRASWTLVYGPIPEGLWVLHRCDNPPCVRPEHLFLGDPTDNNRDTVAKGRMPKTMNRFPVRRGSANQASKVTESDVRVIRELNAMGTTQDELAARYGMTQSGISSIVTRRSWAHVQ